MRVVWLEINLLFVYYLIFLCYFVYSVCYSPDGKTLASGSVDKTVRIWDTSSGECVHELKGQRGREQV